MPTSNINQGGYAPPGYTPNAPSAPGNFNPGAPQLANYVSIYLHIYVYLTTLFKQ